jgi:hypothetical protein
MIPIKVVTIHEAHPDLVRRELHEVTRSAHYAMGVVWARELLPEHFHPSATAAFGYQSRTAKHNRRKRALAAIGQVEDGGNSPLVFTGRLRRDLLRAVHMIRAFPTRVTIDLVGPSYWKYRRRPSSPDMVREVLAMSPRHERIVGQAGDKGFEAALRMVRSARRTRKVTTIGRAA